MTAKAPSGLSERACGLWGAVLEEFELSAAEQVLLHEGLTALDRAAAAGEVVAAEGVTVKDRYGSAKSHPACDVESRNRALFASIIRQLGVNESEPHSRADGSAKNGPAPRTALRRVG